MTSQQTPDIRALTAPQAMSTIISENRNKNEQINGAIMSMSNLNGAKRGNNEIGT